MRAALRRTDEPVTTYALEALRIELDQRKVLRDGHEVHLTPIEYNLLARLARSAGRVVTHRQLSPTSGARSTWITRITASTWDSCGPNSSTIRPCRVFSSPKPAWGIALPGTRTYTPQRRRNTENEQKGQGGQSRPYLVRTISDPIHRARPDSETSCLLLRLFFLRVCASAVALALYSILMPPGA